MIDFLADVLVGVVVVLAFALVVVLTLEPSDYRARDRAPEGWTPDDDEQVRELLGDELERR